MLGLDTWKIMVMVSDLRKGTWAFSIPISIIEV